MFRISRFVRELNDPTPARPRRDPPGPVVIWNLIRRCNLTCKHCYSISADKDFPGELSTEEVFAVLDDLKALRVPALILSGGEPLLRPDIFEISRRAKDMGFYVGLSTNGTRIDAATIGDIATVGYDYVGISIDGLRETHDKFRRCPGAFEASMRGVRRCREHGLKVGLRFTMTDDNAAELPKILDLLDAEDIERFYFSHLNYAGRGNHNRRTDAAFGATRRAMELLFEHALGGHGEGRPRELVSGNNDADGVYLLFWVRRRFPEMAEHIHAKLVEWGGNASGVNVANIDNVGDVHPDTMWWHHTLGNVRQRPFSHIWTDVSEPLMAGLKSRPRPLKGRCAACRYVEICGGNTRVRADQVTGDPWAEDPGCYLSDVEIGLAETARRIPVTPFSASRGKRARA
ncbi:MAG: heme d1 biosynthesis radical SAM protein NirJ [Rhodospirillales bacterium]|jgi:heme d1 biosynthesis radical SAM protein NirJ|nr:heme d1 biosynthesis radical SAM protein NirJ [Rhodospirillales bacterium]